MYQCRPQLHKLLAMLCRQFGEVWINEKDAAAPMPQSLDRRRWDTERIARRQKGCLGAPYTMFNLYPYDICPTPEEWSVMANGTDYNYGRTPCNFSLYERYALGFAQPEVINEAGHFTIDAISACNQGYRINTPEKKEYFLLENRQYVKWDIALPGHGMLIFRVDSTDASAWNYNSVNDNPEHPYYELIRAKGTGALASRDPFPGKGNVTTIDNQTLPANLMTWSGKKTPIGLKNIAENNGLISFDAFDVDVLTSITLPETQVMGYGTTMKLTPVLEPEYANVTLSWHSNNTSVATVDTTGLVTAVGIGTAYITVTANNQMTAVCHVTVEERKTAADIASFRALPEGTQAQLDMDGAKVLFVNGPDIYVRDDSGSMMLSDTGLSASQDDVLNGSIYGQLTFVNNMPKLVPVENVTTPNSLTVTESSEAAVAREVKIADLTDQDLCDLIVVRATPLTNINKMWFAMGGDNMAQIFNTFKLKGLTSFKTYTDKYFDIHAILTTTVIDDSVCYVLSMTESMVEVEKPTPLQGDVNNDGTVDVADIASILSVMAGFAILDADVNKDGIIDVADVSAVLNIMAQ